METFAGDFSGVCATTCFRAWSVVRESNSERELAWKVQWTFSMRAQKRALIVRASWRFFDNICRDCARRVLGSISSRFEI